MTDINERARRAERLAQHRQLNLFIESARNILELVERANVAKREIPQHAMHVFARVGGDAGEAFGHDENAMPREAPAPERARERTALGHAG